MSIRGKNSIGLVLSFFGAPIPMTPVVFGHENLSVGIHLPASEMIMVSETLWPKSCDRNGKAEVTANKTGNPAKYIFSSKSTITYETDFGYLRVKSRVVEIFA